MENYAAYSYPDSGNSSPRSREIEFENPPSSWDDQPLTSSNSNSSLNKVKFMVSYGGKIQPRPHDNQLAYVGGETKILAVDRSVRFPSLLSKLASLFPDAAAAGDLAFKYQLPGEDLDALISVTNDDDLDHLMHEHDRSCRSSKPARLRIFLFSAASSAAINLPSPTPTPPPALAAAAAATAASAHHHHHGREGTTYGSTDSAKSTDRERMFVEALNSSAPPPPPPLTATAPVVAAAPHQPTAVGANNVDFLFGLEKGIGGVVPVSGAIHGQPPPPLQHQQQVYHHQHQQVGGGGGGVPGQTTKLHDPISDPDYGGGASDPQIDARIQELRRLQLSAAQQHHHQLQQLQQHQHQQQQMLYHQQKNEENLLNVDPSYAQRFQHLQQQQQQQQAAYWGTQPEKNIGGTGGFQPTTISGVEQQPVYMIPATGGVYHAPPVMRPAAAAAAAAPSATTLGGGQHQPGYFPVQRVAPEVYRDMPVYGIVSTAPPPTVPATVSSQGMGMQVRQMAAEMGGYVAYDSAGRQQVYYAAPGGGGGGGGSGGSGGMAPYQVGVGAANTSSGGAVVVNSDGRPAGGGEGVRTVPKVANTSATL